MKQFPRNIQKKVLQESMVRDAFGNRIILIEKLIGYINGMNNEKYTLPLIWIKPFNKTKVTQFTLRMSLIRNQYGGLIVQGDMVTIFKRADEINMTSFMRETYLAQKKELN